MRVVLLFIDGVGIGQANPEINPLARAHYLLSQFQDAPGAPLPAAGTCTPVDTTFGTPGRPQSASNQAAILTGEPIPRRLQQHVLGFPTASLRAILREHSLIQRLALAGRTATFANAFPAGYLEALGLKSRPTSRPDIHIPPKLLRRLRAGAFSLAFAAAEVALRTLDDARSGLALTNDICGARAQARGFDVPLRSASEAADIFWRVAGEANFTLFEYSLADEAGHAQDFALATEALESFDTFARAVLMRQPPDSHVLICSDHGNVEDLSTRGHTLHPVAVLYFGSAAWVPSSLNTVADVGKAILRLLDASPL